MVAVAVVFLVAINAGDSETGDPEATSAVTATHANDAGATDGESVVREVTSSSPGGTEIGIKVSGHWTIEVKDPDGSLVSQHEFENGLTGGALAMTRYLARNRIVGEWQIILADLQGAPEGGHVSPVGRSDSRLGAQSLRTRLAVAGSTR